MERRTFIKALAAATVPLVTSASLAGENAEAESTGAERDWMLAGPCLQMPTGTDMSIVWMTRKDCACHVEFGEDNDLGDKAYSSTDGLIDANCRTHKVTLTGLKPGASYSYRIVARQIDDFQPYKVTYGPTFTSETRRFKALSDDAGEVRFACLNDIHDNIPLLRRLVALTGNQPELFFLNGDIVNDPCSEQQVVSRLLAPYGELFAGDRPFVYVRGNHETRGSHARRLRDYLALPDGRFYFSFDHGPVHFTVLDCGEDKEDASPEYSGLADFDRYRTVQQEWLRQEVQTDAFRNAPFRVLMTHMPFFGADSDWHGPADCRAKWADILNQAGIDVHFCGHTHRPALVQPQPGIHDFPVVVGGGPKDENATVIMAKATDQSLTAEILDVRGKVLQTVSIDRR